MVLVAFTGYAAIVQLLINAGAEIHARDREAHTAMSIADRTSFTRIKSLLITQG